MAQDVITISNTGTESLIRFHHSWPMPQSSLCFSHAWAMARLRKLRHTVSGSFVWLCRSCTRVQETVTEPWPDNEEKGTIDDHGSGLSIHSVHKEEER